LLRETSTFAHSHYPTRRSYQLLDYTDDVNLKSKLAQWEQFYNFSRPHGAFKGKTPYEALREKL
jgi:transposase InsO family protein